MPTGSCSYVACEGLEWNTGTFHRRAMVIAKLLVLGVGVHQGSGLSLLLFVIVMEAISREFWIYLPWELLYGDDLVVMADNKEEVIENLILGGRVRKKKQIEGEFIKDQANGWREGTKQKKT